MWPNPFAAGTHACAFAVGLWPAVEELHQVGVNLYATSAHIASNADVEAEIQGHDF